MRMRDHLFPESVGKALQMLEAEDGKARLLGGGTDLIVALREGRQSFEVLVDTSRIHDLDGIEYKGEEIRLGARVTMAQAEEDENIRKYGTALSEGCGWVGGPQIRNRATIVGNIVTAQPAADAAVPLHCLNANLVIVSSTGERTIPLEEAYLSEGGSAIDPSREIVTAVLFRAQRAGESSAFNRMMRRKAMALPVLNCAVWLAVNADRFQDARVALGPIASRPLRVREAEAALRGQMVNEKTIQLAAEIGARHASPRDSPYRGSAAYRREMVKVIIAETIRSVLARLKMEV